MHAGSCSGEGDVGTKQLITVLEHIVRQRFDEKLIREKNGHLARDVLVPRIMAGMGREFGKE